MKYRATLVWPMILMAFALGVVCGRLQLGENSETIIAARAPNPGVTSRSVAARDLANPREAVAEVAKKPRDTLERLNVVAEMNARLNTKFTVSLTAGDVLNPDFVKMFGLTPAEESRLNGEMAAAKLRLAQLEASHARITRTQNGGLVITIPPFPVEGGEVYNTFEHALRETLGAERFSYREQMLGSGSQDDYNFGNFGLTDSVINVKLAGERSTTTSEWASDQKTGLVTMHTDASLDYLRALRPQLYQKLVAGGYVPNSSPK
jgi:hypothetical protein